MIGSRTSLALCALAGVLAGALVLTGASLARRGEQLDAADREIALLETTAAAASARIADELRACVEAREERALERDLQRVARDLNLDDLLAPPPLAVDEGGLAIDPSAHGPPSPAEAAMDALRARWEAHR